MLTGIFCRTIGAKALTSPEITQRVTVDYMMAAVKAFSTLKPKDGKKFRFVFTSGKMSVADRKERLWLFKEARYISVHTLTLFSRFLRCQENFNKSLWLICGFDL